MSRIDSLLAEGNNEEALDLLDSINWKKMHNVNFLLGGAERYEYLEKLLDAKDLLLLAHERSPVGRMIIYRLAIVCAHLTEIEEANGYYQKFIELAPNDNIRFIIKYEINRCRNASDITLISILEELKSHELVEEWAFELACLYRKTGQVDKCINVLDEIILWFGEGPYVEKAYEMKLMYTSLSKEQEIHYQNLMTKDSQMVEIHPGESAAKHEMLGHTIRIPEIEESKEKYNTQNLQAEIKKNIEEIMKASEMEEVSDNMEAIRSLVEDIPHLQIKEERTAEEKKQDTQRLNDRIKSKFEEYLSEEFDGQLSLLETGYEIQDDQIEGQLSVNDITNNWEKTKRAAEQALNDAKEQELLSLKEEALKQAGDVLDRLLESEQKLHNEDTQDVENQEDGESTEQEKKSFHIPDATESENGEKSGKGFDIPIISAEEVLQEAENDIQKEEEKATDWNPPNLTPEQAMKDLNDMLQNEIDKLTKEEEKTAEEEANDKTEEDENKDIETEENYNTTLNLPRIDISDIGVEIQTALTDKEKELLSYFAGIPGLEGPLCKLLTGSREALKENGPMEKGHIIIQGRPGSGKTKLAQNIIKVLQEETDKLTGNIGRIGAGKLNEKDFRQILEKVRGGALIIENAGRLTKDTIVSILINTESEDIGTLIIIEDTRAGIDELLKIDPRFAKKFTERVSIPIMTIDELANFAKIYSAEQGFGIDEMGVLALYDRINSCGRQDQPASIADVKDIVDEAIDNSKNKKRGLRGLFSGKNDDIDMPVLQEKDFRDD